MLDEKQYLESVFSRFNGYPTPEQLWQFMDEQWLAFDCDPNIMDERITAFYRHPVWLLNRLFIEQHASCQERRAVFCDWVAKQTARRCADFGRGFGGLARLIGQALPDSYVEVIEPHPHPSAIALAADTPNVRFVAKLTGEYDMLIATDVFEHVPDPLGLAAKTATHLGRGGDYLIANCFQRVMRCDLPQLFYFQIGWDPAMKATDLTPGETVAYGRAYRHAGDLDLVAAHGREVFAKRLYPWLSRLPRGKRLLGNLLFKVAF